MKKRKAKSRGKSETREILQIVNFIKDRMATREEVNEGFSEVRADLRDIRQELKDIKHRLDVLEDQFKNLKGVTKEIDELRDRVRTIEKQLAARR
ncbi:hypothetical protein A2853_01505 [Candidatus Kaiserbacteria bacterium RIFCSPHIGHO2_01_FULL_55_17]|uniref:Uncharacterized protein n=1 Tax=Candidatus Kaiserbacteria bacterium RIFCSPHIGHO2_01_FULL_55_17 TaxID=1798484 RepID=A0A1F6D9Q7_9BACT|nr:MAG: hypothetical protein A2853_01505 [Candidatus Kaiserbacteria bacterium RIFCSPHIGHO2_01_FULL_55_17]